MHSGQHISWLTDKKFDKCDWIKQGEILSIQLPETFSPVKLTLLTQPTYKSNKKEFFFNEKLQFTDVNCLFFRIFKIFYVVSGNFWQCRWSCTPNPSRKWKHECGRSNVQHSMVFWWNWKSDFSKIAQRPCLPLPSLRPCSAKWVRLFVYIYSFKTNNFSCNGD